MTGNRRAGGRHVSPADPVRVSPSSGGPPDPLLVVLDEKGRVVHFSSSCEAATGFASEEVVGHPIWHVLIPEDEVEAVQDVFRSLRTGDASSTFVNDWLTRDAGRLRIGWSNTRLPAAEGESVFIVGAGTLTGERRSTEEAGRGALASLVHSSVDAVVTVDGRQRITFFNEGAERIFGYRSGEVLGRPLDMLLPERHREAHHEHLRRFARSGVASRRMGERSRIFALAKGGRELPAEASIGHVRVRGRDLFTVVLRDVSARERVEEAQRVLAEAGAVLAASPEPSETVAAIADLCVRTCADACVVHPAGAGESTLHPVVRAADPRLQARLERLVRDWPLRPDDPLCPAASALRTRTPRLIRRVLPLHLAATSRSEAHHRALRALGLVSVVVVPLPTGGEPLGVLVLASTSAGRVYDGSDLALATELGRRLAETLEGARRLDAAHRGMAARDDAVRILSHDLRNPLIGARLLVKALEGILSPGEAPTAAFEHLRMLRRAIEEMEELVENLLDIGRIEAGGLELRLHPVDVRDLVEDALAAVSLQAETKGIAVESDVQGGIPRLRADGPRVRQVLRNLLGNALRFTPAGGRVRVDAETTGDGAGVAITVADTGPGIRTEELSRVFDRFWQAPGYRGTGVGLGLAIAAGIVEAHGGEIGVESRPGEGATFRITLPTPAREEEVSSGPNSRSSSPRAPSGARSGARSAPGRTGSRGPVGR